VPDFPPCDDVCGALEEHVRRFFAGRTIDVFTWRAGPIREQNPHFRVLRVSPETTTDVWTYVSVGGWAATDEDFGMEFLICTPSTQDRAVELLAMTVFYNREGTLDIGHTLPIGEPWLPGSKCDHLLVSLPYPFGPDLQTCHVGDRHVEFLWLLPISEAERDLKISSGLEALESRFDEVGLKYWQIDRASVAWPKGTHLP
jgi:suppressor of fused protein SUFU